MSVPRLTAATLAGTPGLPLLVLGPSLGTSARTLWSGVAQRLADRYHVVAWDLPGHGANPTVGQPFTMSELAAGVLSAVDDVLGRAGAAGSSFGYAGDSVGGAVGLHLLLDAPARVDHAVLISTGARIGEARGWHERAATVRASGTGAPLEQSAGRWFAPGFLEREPDTGAALLRALQETDREGYAQVCEALAGHDVRGRLADVRAPVVAVAGREDVVTPPALLRQIAEGVVDGSLVVLDDVAHLPPAEALAAVAEVVRAAGSGAAPRPAPTVAEVRDAGQAVRRQVLGDAHVDRAAAAQTDFTREFQELISTYAWGTIWTRPGLDRRSRSLITLTALVARGHHDELAMHVRAARTNGLTVDEIKELLLQTAVYCGVPDANTAFRIAQGVLSEMDQEQPEVS